MSAPAQDPPVDPSAARTGRSRTALADVPGAPESRLSPALLADLPEGTPAPPWRCRVEAVVWWHRATPAALAALAEGPPAPGRRLPLVVGALVRYLASPVGPYEEVIGAVLTRPLGVHVPFIAVDSLASVHGGRAHWALPKALAAFSRDAEVVAAGEGWRVGARPHPRGPLLPVAGRLPGRQARGDGALVRSTSTAYGTGRLARVDVRVGSDLAGVPGSIAGWLRSGRHPGMVLRARLTVR